MKTHILMYRSEKKRQIDIIDLKALPHNDRVYFKAQNYSSLLQNGPLKWTSNRDRLFLSLQNNQGDRPFLCCTPSRRPHVEHFPLDCSPRPTQKHRFQPIDMEQSRAFRSNREKYRPLKCITLTGCWVAAIDEKG